MVDSNYDYHTLQHQLKQLLGDSEIYAVVLNNGFDPSFVAYCTKIRDSVVDEKRIIRNK
ncbi:hypothetical protein GCM10027592_57500 [Spirosoma flavus]